MYDHRVHSVNDRIVSICQPHIRPIVRGKARHKTKFGAKVSISLIDGSCYLDTISWDSYNESQVLILNQFIQIKYIAMRTIENIARKTE